MLKYALFGIAQTRLPNATTAWSLEISDEMETAPERNTDGQIMLLEAVSDDGIMDPLLYPMPDSSCSEGVGDAVLSQDSLQEEMLDALDFDDEPEELDVVPEARIRGRR